MLGVLLRNFHQEHHWDEDKGRSIELGDMVLTSNYGHSAVVVDTQGDDPSQIFVIQASYSRDKIERIGLAGWGISGIHYGHPRPPGG